MRMLLELLKMNTSGEGSNASDLLEAAAQNDMDRVKMIINKQPLLVSYRMRKNYIPQFNVFLYPEFKRIFFGKEETALYKSNTIS